jgi:hypothetical protein
VRWFGVAKSVRTFSEWERVAARSCSACGRKVLTKDASMSRQNADGTVSMLHAECMRRARVVMA